ncbi:MAG TPA: branched-chain amino acid ABC transporter permease [Candidatus Saccharimonadales bacterium]|nr:branched-chain amino acid ABC transporter permease [Candidatus Saccharimonadales bacterium]
MTSLRMSGGGGVEAVGAALHRPAGAAMGLVAAVALVFGFAAIATGFAFQLIDTICYYAMLALGLNLVMGFAGQFDFGHTTFFAVGAYVAGLLMIGVPGLDFVAVMALACAAAALVALLLALPIFRFRGDYLALVTLGFALIAQSIALNLDITGGPNGLPGIPVAHILGLRLEGNEPYYFLGVLLTAGCALIVWLLTRVRAGRAILAIREDELAAATVGVDPWRTKVLAFVVAGAFAGIAGAYAAGLFSFVGPDQFGLDQAILLTEMVLVGGLGSIAGSIAGAVVFVAIQSVLVVFVPALAGHEDLLIGLLMLVVVLSRPQGLFGKPFVRRRA